MRRQHAHPDPRVRYLAHEEVQPVDRWSSDITLVLLAAAFLLFIGGVAQWLNPV